VASKVAAAARLGADTRLDTPSARAFIGNTWRSRQDAHDGRSVPADAGQGDCLSGQAETGSGPAANDHLNVRTPLAITINARVKG